jgi:hypothetical protein
VLKAAVERVSHFGSTAKKEGIFTGRGVGAIGGHGNLVAGVQPVMGAVPADRAAQRGGPAVAQGVEC